jgi:hypothetical protein
MITDVLNAQSCAFVPCGRSYSPDARAPSIRPQPAGRFDGTVVSDARAGAHEMNRTALTNIALDIFRKRLLIEGYFQSDMAESVLRDYFRHIASEVGLRTYGDPIIHKTSG